MWKWAPIQAKLYTLYEYDEHLSFADVIEAHYVLIRESEMADAVAKDNAK